MKKAWENLNPSPTMMNISALDIYGKLYICVVLEAESNQESIDEKV
jgi:hypothetical protein